MISQLMQGHLLNMCSFLTFNFIQLLSQHLLNLNLMLVLGEIWERIHVFSCYQGA